MVRYLLLALLYGIRVANAVVIDEGLLVTAKIEGTKVYVTCILTPPVTVAQQSICAGLYSTYNTILAVLNAPLPMVLSLEPDPYIWSPYDICRYETGHIVFGEQLLLPYCPSI